MLAGKHVLQALCMSFARSLQRRVTSSNAYSLGPQHFMQHRQKPDTLLVAAAAAPITRAIHS